MENNIKYIDQYTQLHKNVEEYGASGCLHFNEVCLLIDFLKPKTVMDYGCGKGTLIEQLKEKYSDIVFYKYDPAIEEYNTLPVNKVDFLINTDVLEHIPENNIENVIREISSISDNCFFNLHHGAAMFILPNGENAHCTIKPADWYYNIMYKYFKIVMPLPGRSILTSVVLTFGLRPDLVYKYQEIISPSIPICEKATHKIIKFMGIKFKFRTKK